MTRRDTRTLCPYCGVGCGLVASTERGRLVEVAGDPIYPVNHGRTCRKPRELPHAVHAADRAVTPLLRSDRESRFRERSWDEAFDWLAPRLRGIIDEHGPDAVAFYISGQLLTEDYYAVNKLAKGFLGTNNVDSNSRLCMSSAVAGYDGAFGSDGPPPGYADLDLADCFFLLGSNAAACHPIVWGRIADRRREGALVICADPRATQTARAADLHLPVRPGTDLALLNAMLHVIVRDRLLDSAFVASRTSGFDEAAAVAAEWGPERAAAVCGVPAADIERAARAFATARAAMALWSMGANQSAVGTLKNRALINLCLATGQLGRPGAGPLSLTGQPNAMGGRETGGLAHLLPGYRKVASAEDRAEIERHWSCPPLSPKPGLTAVDLFAALEAGAVKAVWIVATNPAASFPDGARVRAALERAELVVVQDAHHPTDTGALAHAVLPAAAWPEKTGTMTNSERRVGLVQAALPAPGRALPDWQIFARLARALGYGDAFAWPDAATVFDEYAACTAGRVCDVSDLSHERLRREGGVQWPAGTPRLYEHRRFHTPDGRARFGVTPHSGPAEPVRGDAPLTLTTGRLADHWHTLTRTGKSPALRQAAGGEPQLELHPDDAAAAGLHDGQRAKVTSARGEAVLQVAVTDAVPPGVAFAPMHWGPLHAPGGAGAVNGLTHRATDPTSRQPELKASAVAVAPAPRRYAVRNSPYGRPSRAVRLVVIGTGMAGLTVVEELLRRAPRDAFAITMLGEEPDPTYNRILLSKVLAGSCGADTLQLRPPAWYVSRQVDLRRGTAAVAIDVEKRVVTDERGRRHPYDRLVLATGSRPFVPPIPGREQAHVHVFRTMADVAAIEASAHPGRPAVVIGGGLLGLEAAAGLHGRGVPVTVVELSDRVMPQQVDPGAGALLARALRELGLELRLGVSVNAIRKGEVELSGGEALAADTVVVAAGVRPEVSLAAAAGIETGRGILVDDQLRTGAPSVWAVGECAEHRGVVHGLWAPLAEQARVAGAVIAGDPAGFHGAVAATTLKVAGVDVFAGGRASAADGEDEIILSDSRRGVYRKLVLDGNRLVGGVLVGDTAEGRALSELLRGATAVPESLLVNAGAGARASAPANAADTVCSCNAVTRGTIDAAIRDGGLTTISQLAGATRASTGCGSCAGELAAILGEHDPTRSSDRNTEGTVGKSAPGTIAA